MVLYGNIGGTYPGTLTITSNDPDQPEIVVNITVVVNDNSTWPQADIDMSPINLALRPGETATVYKTITSVGSGDLIWQVAFTGPILFFPMPGGLLVPGDHHDIEIQVTAPGSPGSYQEDFQILTNEYPPMSLQISVYVDVTS
jgi:hypothetical protein